MTTELKQTISHAVKEAMRAKSRDRLGVLRFIMSEFKRIEVDERIEVDDARALVVLDKMVKQRKDSAKQFADNARQDLADKELFEIGIIQEFLPQALTQDELSALVAEAVASSGATSMAQMGKVMAIVKPQVQGRADMGQVSQLVKAAFSA